MTAVLDWEMATVGNPCPTWRRCWLYWTPADEIDLMVASGQSPPSPVFLVGTRSPFYALLSGRDISDLQFYLAFAYFK